MTFRVLGLSPAQFRPLFDLPDTELQRRRAWRVIADDPRLPCRVSMEHAHLGEELLLLNFEHQPADTPYRGAHAIYVRRSADRAYNTVGVIPEVLSSRLLAVRAFDARHIMIDAEVFNGSEACTEFERLLAAPKTVYLQVHNARRGCYAARVERA